MSRSEDFDSEFWSDPDVADLSRDARYLYIWTWTNPRCNMSGAYRVTWALIEAETGLARAEAETAFGELEERRFAYYDGRYVWVRSRVRRLRQKTTNIGKSIEAHLRKLPEGHPYVAMFVEEYERALWLRPHIEALSKDGLESVADTQEIAYEQGISPTLSGVSPETPRDGDGDIKEGGVGETNPAAPPSPPPVKFNGRVAPAAAVRAAATVLADFNSTFGTSFSQRTGTGKIAEGFKRILGAVLEHEMTADEGQRINAEGKANPWWPEGQVPHPGMLFGPNVIERNLQTARSATAGPTSLADLVDRMNGAA